MLQKCSNVQMFIVLGVVNSYGYASITSNPSMASNSFDEENFDMVPDLRQCDMRYKHAWKKILFAFNSLIYLF